MNFQILPAPNGGLFPAFWVLGPVNPVELHTALIAAWPSGYTPPSLQSVLAMCK